MPFKLLKVSTVSLLLAFAAGCSFEDRNKKEAISCLAGAPVCENVQINNLEPKLAADIRKKLEEQANFRQNAARLAEAANQAAIADAQAKVNKEQQEFQKEGWFEKQPGIYARWCNDCAGSTTYADYAWRMEVWCKEAKCGDIYARINISQGADGPVIAWTNDTGYGDLGQKVVLTFQSATQGNASLTEFVARGN
jgi:hypothetical protein